MRPKCGQRRDRFDPAFLAAGIAFIAAALAGAQDTFFGLGAAFVGLAVGPLLRPRTRGGR